MIIVSNNATIKMFAINLADVSAVQQLYVTNKTTSNTWQGPGLGCDDRK